MPAAAFTPNLITSSPSSPTSSFLWVGLLQSGQYVTTIAFGNNPLIRMRRPVSKGMRHFFANNLYLLDWTACCKDNDPMCPFLQMIWMRGIGGPVVKGTVHFNNFFYLMHIIQMGLPVGIVLQIIWTIWNGRPIVKRMVGANPILERIWIIPQLGWDCWLSG